MFNSPNTAAMMGAVPVHRRGIAAGARTMLQNTGAVLSIAFVMAIVTAAVPKDVLLQIFSGLASSLSAAQLDPFIHNMHTALWVLAATSLARRRRCRCCGRRTSAAEPARAGAARDRGGRGAGQLRIGEVAARTGHDAAHDPLLRGDRAAARRRRAPRPARTGSTTRPTSSGSQEVLRLKELLGVSLDELRELVAAERARAALRSEWRAGARRAPRASARSCTRRSATSSASSSSSRHGARRSPASSASWRTSAAALRARLAELERGNAPGARAVQSP